MTSWRMSTSRPSSIAMIIFVGLIDHLRVQLLPGGQTPTKQPVPGSLQTAVFLPELPVDPAKTLQPGVDLPVLPASVPVLPRVGDQLVEIRYQRQLNLHLQAPTQPTGLGEACLPGSGPSWPAPRSSTSNGACGAAGPTNCLQAEQREEWEATSRPLSHHGPGQHPSQQEKHPPAPGQWSCQPSPTACPQRPNRPYLQGHCRPPSQGHEPLHPTRTRPPARHQHYETRNSSKKRKRNNPRHKVTNSPALFSTPEGRVKPKSTGQNQLRRRKYAHKGK